MAERIEQVQRAFTAHVIERELGSGGMATVYLAHDRKHERKIAIKILHAELAAALGAERFLREIRVTANLQHPHILGLIDSGVIGEGAGELKGRPYYVMPYIDGESLRQRLEREQQLPVADSVQIATEVASALDYAHRRGVIHRDIKPENILLHDGSAIVTDFGIALAVTQAGGARMTQTGFSLGTPSYMSPEQAMGERTITARSDIYSLGAVTYEMLSGEPPFTGPTVQALVARVMTEEPRPLTAQRRSVPPHVAAAVSRALEKVPADRFASALEFSEALHNSSFIPAAPTSSPVARERNSRRVLRALYGAGALLILTAVAAIWGWFRAEPARQVVRYALVFDSTEAMAEGGNIWGRLALSPDGSRLAYIGRQNGQVIIRSRNQLGATAIPGVTGAVTPFFSPDGKQVGFVNGRLLRIAPVDGGAPITVTDSLVGTAGISWGEDNFIYADGWGLVSLVRLEPKAGAVPKRFTVLDTAKGEFDHSWPDALPNKKGVLFTVSVIGRTSRDRQASYSIAVAELPSGKHRVLVENATHARYAASGHLLYATPNRTLMSVPFDQNSMELIGEPIALSEGIRVGVSGSTDVTVSRSGTLMYTTRAGEDSYELAWVTREGRAQPVDSDLRGNLLSPSISPDGQRLALSMNTSVASDIWVKRLDRGPTFKLTLDGAGNAFPTWTPDGGSVTYSSNAGETAFAGLWSKRADGSAQAEPVFREKRNLYGARWSPDGKWLLFWTGTAGVGRGDILALRPGIDTLPVPLAATEFTEMSPALSPSGRWLAYTSNESGKFGVYVVPFPNTGSAKWEISTRGGSQPVWSHSGRELFYRDAAGNLIAVEVNTGLAFSFGRSTELFSAAGFRPADHSPQYAVSRDDRRFLMLRRISAVGPDELIVVENWFEELKGRLPE
jgi:Tol biopolymer transport system component/tRNA A-37 threonylcarbamoyl transferase component Bud32